MEVYGGVEVHFQSFLASALDGNEVTHHAAVASPPQPLLQSVDWEGPTVTGHLLMKIKLSYSTICTVLKITFILCSCLGHKTLVYCIRY